MKSWLAIALEESVRRRAFKVAVIVGSILALINHGDAMVAGMVTLTIAIKIALTFLVPYCVFTYSSVQAIRHGNRG